jgi:monothiol glutaredoxin
MERNITDEIQKAVDDNKVVLFMKGTPTFPQCGFSSTIVQILKELNADFVGVNVLDDPEVRQGIKSFSSWPTIPQLYVGGEFIGGSDITRELFDTGELGTLIEGAGGTNADA